MLGRDPDLPGLSLLGFMACAAMVGHDAFFAVGGFDAVVRFPGEEERVALDLAAAGWSLAYVEDVVVHHHPSLSRDTSAERRVSIARSKLLAAVLRRPWSFILGEALLRCVPVRPDAPGCWPLSRVYLRRCGLGGGRAILSGRPCSGCVPASPSKAASFTVRRPGYENFLTGIGGGLDRDGDEYSLRSRIRGPRLLSQLPVLPGLHLDAHCLAASAEGVAGRAWFDVIALADGRAAMLVGDVVEQGLTAEAVTGQVRAVLVPLLTDNQDLVAVLERLSQTVDVDDAAYATTVCVAIVDPIDGDVQYSNCGHAPPIVVARGSTRTLPSTGGGILRRNQPVAIETAHLDRNEVLVLYTDGFSPESRRAMVGGLAGLPYTPDVMHGVGRQANSSTRCQEVCRTTADELLRRGSRDLAVLAVQHRPGVPRLDLTVPAVAASLETVGAAVGEWLAGLRSSVEDGAGIALAVGEAMANAIQHAFVGERIGSVTVEATLLADGVLACSVRDDGRWLPSKSSTAGYPGRGLRLMARVCDRMMVHREPDGTVVELRRRLHRPVSRATASDTG